MKSLLGTMLILLLCLSVTGCSEGQSNKAEGSRSRLQSRATSQTLEARAVLDFGKAANPVDRQAVRTLVKRYYAAAAAENGAMACSLIFTPVAESVAEDYGRAPGPPYLRGSKTCDAVMSRLFAYLHRQMVVDNATLQVTRVRLKSKGGYAVLRFGATPEREITIVRDNGVWKVSSLVDSEISR
jgi:hypothetical protein